MSNKLKISQQLIVDTALEIAKESGMEAVTMANIARTLQIKPPSLYNHFVSLHDIKQAMAFKAQSMLVSYLNERLQHIEQKNKLKSFSLAYYKFACEHHGYYEASIIALDSSKGLTALPATQLTSLIKEALDMYELNDEALIHTIRGLRSMLHGLIDLSHKGGFKLEVNIEQTIEYVLDLFIIGLEKS